MAWMKMKTAVVVGVGVLLAAGTAVVLVDKLPEANRMKSQLAHAGTTQMNLTGTTGAWIVGFYTQNDLRVAVSNSLPWSFAGTNISSFEFRKINLGDTVIAKFVYDGYGAHARQTLILDPKRAWIQGQVENGLIVMMPE